MGKQELEGGALFDQAGSGDANDRDFVTALARGLKVLQAFRSGEERLSNADLAQRCDLPRSTVVRLTHTLTRVGFLHQVEEYGRYRLGLATLTLGRTMLGRLDFRDASGELLQQLANEARAMVAVGIREEFSVLYVDTRRSQSTAVTLNLGIGSRLPLATTAMGLAHLLIMEKTERSSLLARMQRLDPASGSHIDRALELAAAEMQQWGCVTSFGQWKKEINGIAVPLNLGGSLPPAVINVAAPVSTINSELFLSDIRPLLIETKLKIEAQYRAV
ncbi:IclR family transcriptional regulator [Achromobacter sp. MFA1 R4]|uniref:IclR family transcriptional regulator n=1 Tax=Achromobacter sp. MFA1 R4 TaxID=1881016 RepID=UPI00095392CF|nr:IclR family transcriptional regulator [Achromobacter sp. MFA1 R4]SIT17851.1 transcriptional regulator, IclR family [Achromobacter sp. MFA1 R4]